MSERNPSAGPADAEAAGEAIPAGSDEWELAHELLTQESGLWTEILYALLGGPRRYSDLKPLLDDQAENTLTYALKKLGEEGLVKRRSDLVDDELVKQYEITNKGIDTFLKLYLISNVGRMVDLVGPVGRREPEPGGSAVATTLVEGAAAAGPDIPIAATEGGEGPNIESKPSGTGTAPWARSLAHLRLGPEGPASEEEGRSYHIRYNPETGEWRVIREGAERATRNFEEIHLAVSEALQRAGRNGRVVVHNEVGDVEAVIDVPSSEGDREEIVA